MRYIYDGKILEGRIISRPNRFLAEVDLDGQLVLCHVKNTGRMRELMVKGAKCYIREVNNPNRKTKYDVISLVHKGILVNIDSQIPNRVIADAFENSQIRGWENPDSLRREVSVGKSRLDMLVEKDGQKLFVEVKGVDLMKADFQATFPDAPTTRGTKHLRELEDLVKKGNQAMVIFCLHREDAKDFRPNFKMDPEFFKTFYEVLQAGVQARAYTCKVGRDYIELDKEIKILSKEEAKSELDQ
ncbi:MAG: DNA/RNA nuclease SfsA [Bacillota bacterium]|nr:DNA/RNA nuclease SfsA [Bacillota bacterium]